MPYIEQSKRDILDPAIGSLLARLKQLQLDDNVDNMEGNINYIFTKILKQCYGDSYAEINDALGVISGVQLEFYRKVAAPYEDQKIYDNGDVEKT